MRTKVIDSIGSSLLALNDGQSRGSFVGSNPELSDSIAGMVNSW